VALVYIDGQFLPPEQAKISVFDHGFLYGDGVFEGIRAYNGRVFKLPEHLDRLYRGAKAILLTIPLTQEQLQQTVLEGLRRSGLTDAYIRLIVTRGKGDLGLDPEKCREGASIVIIVDAITLYPKEVYQSGLKMITVTTRRNLPTAVNPAIKSLNYLNNIIARLEVTRAGCLEGLMLNNDGYVAEATGDNIFLLREGDLLTPPVSAGILDGITRRTVIELAQNMGMKTKEVLLTLYDVYNADECFLTGTAAEIAPVTELDGRTIGEGNPGKLTKALMQRFHDLTQSEGTAF
jgi:branched-chain amino acid aminotransferase